MSPQTGLSVEQTGLSAFPELQDLRLWRIPGWMGTAGNPDWLQEESVCLRNDSLLTGGLEQEPHPRKRGYIGALGLPQSDRGCTRCR